MKHETFNKTEIDLSRPSLRALSFLLRSLKGEECRFYGDVMRDTFGMPENDVERIFYSEEIDVDLITPEMVADDIDAYLAGRP